MDLCSGRDAHHDEGDTVRGEGRMDGKERRKEGRKGEEGEEGREGDKEKDNTITTT